MKSFLTSLTDFIMTRDFNAAVGLSLTTMCICDWINGTEFDGGSQFVFFLGLINIIIGRTSIYRLIGDICISMALFLISIANQLGIKKT